jgi:hypothetical protein
LIGEFERGQQSKVLYLDPEVFNDGRTPFRLTREQFQIVAEATAPAPPVALLNHCWLPSKIAQEWLERHGYRWSVAFEPPAMGEVDTVHTRIGGASALYRTGFAGRPTSWNLIEAECRHRWAAGERHPKMAEWGRVLLAWLEQRHPEAPQPKPKTLANRLPSLLRELEANRPI